jgi:hypothetical protein
MITKFARLEFELFTKPSKPDFLQVHQKLTWLIDKVNIIEKTIQVNIHFTQYFPAPGLR